MFEDSEQINLFIIVYPLKKFIEKFNNKNNNKFCWWRLSWYLFTGIPGISYPLGGINNEGRIWTLGSDTYLRLLNALVMHWSLWHSLNRWITLTLSANEMTAIRLLLTWRRHCTAIADRLRISSNTWRLIPADESTRRTMSELLWLTSPL